MKEAIVNGVKVTFSRGYDFNTTNCANCAVIEAAVDLSAKERTDRIDFSLDGQEVTVFEIYNGDSGIRLMDMRFEPAYESVRETSPKPCSDCQGRCPVAGGKEGVRIDTSRKRVLNSRVYVTMK